MQKTATAYLCSFLKKRAGISHHYSHLKNTGKILLATIAFTLIVTIPAFSQSLTKKITLGFKSQSLQKSLDQIGELSGFRMTYNVKDVVKYSSQSLSADSRTVSATLSSVLSNTGLSFVIRGKNIVIIPRAENPINNPDSVRQEKVIKGKVVDRNGGPLNGISVRVQGLPRGTATNEDGEYTLQAPVDGHLIFSFVGAVSVNESISGRSEINITMTEDSKELNQVVVTGYSNKKASEVTGAVVQLTGEQLLNGVPAGRDIYDLLKGKVAGLLGNTVRGSSDISSVGAKLPLIVLDGNILGNVDINSLVNPNDIETISVLKDAASTAIYGSRAALGVIVVVTKHGKQGLNFNFSSRNGVNTYPHQQRYMTTAQLIESQNKFLGGQWDAQPEYQSLYPSKGDYINDVRTYKDADVANNFDWRKALQQSNSFSDLNLSFNSGSPQSRIFGSLGWYREPGRTLGSLGDRKSVKINSDFNISSKLSFSLSGSAIISKDKVNNGQTDPINYAPWVLPTDANGNYTPSLLIPNGYFSAPPAYIEAGNILYEKQNFDNTSESQNETYMGVFTARYTPWDFLTVQSSNNIYHNVITNNSYYDPRSVSGQLGLYSTQFSFIPFLSGVNANGTLDLSNALSTTYTTSNTIRFNKRYGLSEVSVFGGQEYSRTTATSNSISYYDLLPGERNSGAATSIGDFNTFAYGLPYSPAGSATDYGMFSAFGEASYRYDQRYTITGSLRTDASASFGRNNRYGTFYSISGAWQLDRESFMQNLRSVVNSMKIRYAYGTSGRDLGAAYLNQTFYSNTSSYGGVSRSGSIISQLANPNIRWETTYNHSLGTDFSLFNKISGSVDFYRKRSAGLIQQVTLPATQGGYTQQTNIGEVINKGVEISLRADIIKDKDFSWSVSGNFTYNKNRITKLATSSRTFNRQVGDAIGDIRAIPYQGVNPDNGAPQFKLGDGSVVDGLNATTASDTLNKVKIGNTTPRYYGGFSSSWAYKGFRLTTDWYMELGQIVNNYSQYINSEPSTAYANGGNSYVYPSAWRIWTGPGDKKANMPNIYDGNLGAWMFYEPSNSAFYQKASYLRLRNVRLSYDFSSKILTKLSMKNANVYFNADNVFVFKKSSLWQDYESVYNPMRLVVGVNVNF